MSNTPGQAPQLDGRGRRIGIVVARFNPHITEPLLEGAVALLQESGVSSGDIRVCRVAGAIEIPVVAARLLRSGGVDGVVALGAVIRGGTPHFDYVCRSVTDGCMNASLALDRPITLGVLTCDSDQQARDRSGSGADNKGHEAAAALLECLATLDSV